MRVAFCALLGRRRPVWRRSKAQNRGFQLSIYIHSHHTQWAVGQGFFRTGHVNAADITVDYAYDCGSFDRSARNREIATFAASRTRPLDVVYLSHFHADHVNGVPELFRRVGVERFVIPFVPPVERLIIFAAYAAEPGEPGPAVPAGWYEELIIDPAATLGALGNEVEVIVATQDGTELPQGPFEGSQDDDYAAVWAPPATATGPSASVDIVRGPRRQPLWLWAPYVLSATRSRQAAFIGALAGELGRDAASVEQGLQDAAQVRRLVTVEKVSLVKAYRMASPDLNLTSLCLYSGLTPGSVPRSHHWRSRKGGVDRPEIAAWDLQPGWLGTGDAPLGNAANVDDLRAHYLSVLDGVGVFALPHHGSRHDFHKDLLAMFGPRQPTCVVGVGVGNTYGHPHASVVQAVADHGSHLVAVTGSASSRWTSSATTRV